MIGIHVYWCTFLFLKKKITKYHILKLVFYIFLLSYLNKTKVGQSQKSLIYFEQSESTVAESYVYGGASGFLDIHIFKKSVQILSANHC